MIAGLVIEEAGIGEEQRLWSVGHEIGTRTGGVEARRGGTGRQRHDAGRVPSQETVPIILPGLRLGGGPVGRPFEPIRPPAKQPLCESLGGG